jgi:hypothetical protein
MHWRLRHGLSFAEDDAPEDQIAVGVRGSTEAIAGAASLLGTRYEAFFDRRSFSF